MIRNKIPRFFPAGIDPDDISDKDNVIFLYSIYKNENFYRFSINFICFSKKNTIFVLDISGCREFPQPMETGVKRDFGRIKVPDLDLKRLFSNLKLRKNNLK